MKWAGLVILLASILPVSNWLRRNPGAVPKAWMAVGFLPFVTIPLHLIVAPIFHGYWPGYVNGEITVLDALVLAIYLALPRARTRLPFLIPMTLYFVAVWISVFQAQSPLDAAFYPWQLARMFLLYATLVRACVDDRVAPALLKGMTAGLFLEAGLAVWQRLVVGVLEADGSFAGHNFLGLVSHLIVFPNFALTLAGVGGYVTSAAVLAGIVIEVLTTSRATIGLAMAGFALLFVISSSRRMTPKKIQILSAGVLAVVVLAPLAYSSFQKRFSADVVAESEFDERHAFETAASMILSDHPFGIGPNHYVVVASASYNRLAGVPQVSGENDAFVHNMYWLVAAETGYTGWGTFVLLLICPLFVAFRCGWRNRSDKRGDLLLGLGVALLVVYLHCFYEWIFIHHQAQYLFVMDVGLVAGLAQKLGYWGRPAGQKRSSDRYYRSLKGNVRDVSRPV